MYINRNIEETILKANKEYPVIVVWGQRQVGKSTMLQHIKPLEMKYVSFDDDETRILAKEHPSSFFEKYGYPILIDEFQKAPSILNTIKKIVDELGYEGKNNNGLFWLTGSQNFLMMKDISESLAGRATIFQMSSLSQREIDGLPNKLFNPDLAVIKEQKFIHKSINEIYQRIFNGGMPKIIASHVDREKYYSDYINTYIERDIKSEIKELDKFYKFLVFIAAITGQELKKNEIAKQIGLSVITVENWITILRRSGIIFLLPSYYPNSKIIKTLIRTPKIYFMDVGLAVYLCKWPNVETLQNGNMSGAFLETYVIGEIVKSYYNSGKQIHNLYYYRDKNQNEIDLLIANAVCIYPIEIKKNKDPYKPDLSLKALDQFKKLNIEIKPELVICTVKEVSPRNKNCYLVPISII